MLAFINSASITHTHTQSIPLTRTSLVHVLLSGALVLWALVHTLLHFVSFAVPISIGNETRTTVEVFRDNLVEHIGPTVTGLLSLMVLLVMAFASLGPIRRAIRFVPFYVVHWVCMCTFYLLLLVHGRKIFNYSYWPWLLPAIFLVLFERLYRYLVITRYSVKVERAGRYDDQSRTAIIELERPPLFKFEPGQHILLNLPWIGETTP